MIILKYIREILIAALIAVLAFSFKTCSDNKSNAELLETTVNNLNNEVKYHTNKNKELVGTIKVQTVNIDQLKKYGDELGIDNKKLKKQIGNLNNLVAHWQGKAGIRDTVYSVGIDTVIIDRGDTASFKRFAWTNKYLSLDQLYNPLTDTLKTVYSYDVEFKLTAYRKRQGFLKPKELVTDIYFSDPNFKFQEFRGIVVKEEKKWYERKIVAIALGFAVGFYLGTR